MFDDDETDFYEALYTGSFKNHFIKNESFIGVNIKESSTKFASYVNEGTALKNYAHIFELLMRMRQAVNHPWLVTHSSPSEDVCHE